MTTLKDLARLNAAAWAAPKIERARLPNPAAARLLSVEWASNTVKLVSIDVEGTRYVVECRLGDRPVVLKPDATALRRNSKLAIALVAIARAAIYP